MSVISRRLLLRGALRWGGSVAIGLPVLEAMANGNGTALGTGEAFPTRFVVWFWGNGTVPREWAPPATGVDWALTPTLSGLASVKEHVHLVSGTTLPTRKTNNPHVEGACGILAAGNPVIDPRLGSQNNDWDYMTAPGPSLDELAARVVGPTRVRSLVWAVTSLHGVAGPGTAVRYISHSAPFAFNPPVFNPAQAFQSLFGARTPDPVTASVLDVVLQDAADLKRRLGRADQERLERHLGSIRELELRVREGNTLTCTPGPVPSDPASYRARARTFAELAALAFSCDVSRVVSLCFSSPASHSEYPDIFPRGDELVVNGSITSFHEYEHSKGIDPVVRRGLTYFVDAFGDFVSALKARTEGAGTLLDHSVVLGTSEVSGGNDHSMADFPLLIAGHANGRLPARGTHVRLASENPTRVTLTCLKALGDPRTSLGFDQFATSSPVAALLR
jgi:hypothetical protein